MSGVSFQNPNAFSTLLLAYLVLLHVQSTQCCMLRNSGFLFERLLSYAFLTLRSSFPVRCQDDRPYVYNVTPYGCMCMRLKFRVY